MAIISMRVTEEEKNLINNFARFYGKGVSSYIKDLVLESIEEEYDINMADKAYKEYLKDPETYSIDDMRKIHGL